MNSLFPHNPITGRFSKPLPVVVGLGIALGIILGLVLEINYIAVIGIPLIILYAYYALFDFKKLYFLLFLVLPFTKAFEGIGGYTIDLPGEPILMTLFAVFMMYILAKRDFDKNFLTHPIIILLFAHLGWMFITIFYSYASVISTKFFLSKLWHVVPFTFMTALFIKRTEDFKKLAPFFIIPSTIAVVAIVAYHATWFFSFDSINWACAIFFRNHVNYACYLSLMIPFVWLGTTWYKKGTSKRFWMNVTKVIFIAGVYFAYARGAWLALIACVIFYYALKKRAIKYLLVPGMVLLFALCIHLTTDKQYMDYKPQFEKAISHGSIADLLKATIKNQDISTVERFYRWVAAARMTPENPVTGFGPGSFYHFYKSYTVTDFQTYVSDNPEKSGTHNYFLMTLVEQGVIGFIIFVLLSFLIFYYGVDAYHKATLREDKLFIATILCSFIAIYTQLLLSDLLETIKIGGFYFFNLGLIVNQILYQKNRLNTLKETTT